MGYRAKRARTTAFKGSLPIVFRVRSPSISDCGTHRIAALLLKAEQQRHFARSADPLGFGRQQLRRSSLHASLHIQCILDEPSQPPNGGHHPNNRKGGQKSDKEVQPAFIKVNQNEVDGRAGEKESLAFVRR